MPFCFATFCVVLILGSSLLRHSNHEPLNLGGLTKSAAAMLAAKHASAMKSEEDGDIEVVGVVPGIGSKMANINNREGQNQNSKLTNANNQIQSVSATAMMNSSGIIGRIITSLVCTVLY